MPKQDTKQEVLDRLTSLIGAEHLGIGVGSSVPKILFRELLSHFGLDVSGSMPVGGQRLVEAAGMEWQQSFDSRKSKSGGGSTVTVSGLLAMEAAVHRLLNPTGHAEITKQEEMAKKELEAQGQFDSHSLDDARRRTMAAIVARQGQGKFRADLLAAYSHRCAMTGTQCERVLEAAHIVSYLGPGTNVVSNGLLLRCDLHTLFDFGLIGVREEDYTMITSDALANTEYSALEGKELILPRDERLYPSRNALAQHRLRYGLGG